MLTRSPLHHGRVLMIIFGEFRDESHFSANLASIIASVQWMHNASHMRESCWHAGKQFAWDVVLKCEDPILHQEARDFLYKLYTCVGDETSLQDYVLQLVRWAYPCRF